MPAVDVLRSHRLILFVALAIIAALAAAVGAWLLRFASIGTGFYAKQLCSGVLVAGRPPAQVADQDLAIMWPGVVFRNVTWGVDRGEGRVEASWLGVVRRTAVHRPGHGCTLLAGERDARVAAGTAASRPPPRPLERAAPVPALERVLDDAMAAGTTRAVVVMQHGQLVAERYAPGFDASTRFPGWSVTKSVFNAVVGALVARGALDLREPVRVGTWRVPGDPRGAIRYDALMQMSSGLAFDERYELPFSDVVRMLFAEPAAGAFAATRPLVHAPGTVWQYSSGTTNILAEALRAHVPAGLAYEDLPRHLVFEPLGMDSAVAELDESGTFIASSYMFATARDWAVFGALFAADGVWAGRRLLPEGWVAYSRAPAAAANGKYGAHFWLYDAEERAAARRASAREIPDDAFFAAGYAGQRITIVPSRGAVIVRLGYDIGREPFDNAGFAARALAALEGAGR